MSNILGGSLGMSIKMYISDSHNNKQNNSK